MTRETPFAGRGPARAWSSPGVVQPGRYAGLAFAVFPRDSDTSLRFRSRVFGFGLVAGIGRVFGFGLVAGIGRVFGFGLLAGTGRVFGFGLLAGIGRVFGCGIDGRGVGYVYIFPTIET